MNGTWIQAPGRAYIKSKCPKNAVNTHLWANGFGLKIGGYEPAAIPELSTCQLSAYTAKILKERLPMAGPFKAATRILECSLSYKLQVSSSFWGRAAGRTALEVSKWVETTLETNTDRTVASVGVFELIPLAFTSVPAQNHLPVAVGKGSK